MASAPLFLALAAALGGVGVGLGAFGAHGLRDRLAAAGGMDTWDTAVTYHLVHAVALLGVSAWLRVAATVGGPAAESATPPGLGLLGIAGWSFAAGIVLFSGSLYVLALGGPRWLGPVTPLGGLAFIAGWLALLWAAIRTGSAP